MNRTKSLAIIKMAVPMLFATLFYQNCSPNKTSFSDAGISALSTGQGDPTIAPPPACVGEACNTNLPVVNPPVVDPPVVDPPKKCEDDENFKSTNRTALSNHVDDDDECEEDVDVDEDDAGNKSCKLSKNNNVDPKDISVKIDGQKLDSNKCDIQNGILTFKGVLITDQTTIKVKYKKKKNH